MPAIPPEVLEEILLELPPQDAETLPALLACTSVSHTFSEVVKLDSIWKPIVAHRWSGRAPVFVELSDPQDRQDMLAAFPEGDNVSLSIYGRLVKRKATKRIFDRHFEALLAEPTHQIPHVSALIELGETNIFPFLDWLAFVLTESDDEDDWLSRRDWAHQVRTAISRRKAIDVWKRIAEGWDGPEALVEGVYSFSAFYGDQSVDLTPPAVAPAVLAFFLSEGRKMLLGEGLSEAEALTEAVRELFVGRMLLGKFAQDPNNQISEDPLPLPAHFINEVLAEVDTTDNPRSTDFLAIHPLVITARLFNILSKASPPVVAMKPVHTVLGPMFGVAWAECDGRVVTDDEVAYVGYAPPMVCTQQKLRRLHDTVVAQHWPGHDQVDFADFNHPSTAADMIHAFSNDLWDAIQAQLRAANYADLNTKGSMSCFYALGIVSTLVQPSPRGLWNPVRLGPDALRRILAFLPRATANYPWDIAYVQENVASKLPISGDFEDPPFDLLRDIVNADSIEPEPHHRAGLDVRYRVGDIVKVGGAAGSEVQVITGWDVDSDTESISPQSEQHGVVYRTLDLGGTRQTIESASDNVHHIHAATSEELDQFCKIEELGKFVKRIDRAGPSPRFVIADALKKVYPED